MLRAPDSSTATGAWCSGPAESGRSDPRIETGQVRSAGGADGAQAGPGEVGDQAAELVGVEVLAALHQSARHPFGEADQTVGDRALLLVVDLDGDERGDRGRPLRR